MGQRKCMQNIYLQRTSIDELSILLNLDLQTTLIFETVSLREYIWLSLACHKIGISNSYSEVNA